MMPDLAARIAVLEVELAEKEERIRQLEKELGLEVEAPLCFGLTGSEAAVLGVLMKRAVAMKSNLMAGLYQERFAEAEVPMEKIVDVFVCKMRKKLKGFGIEVETVWGQGYRLSAATKARIEELKGAAG